MSKKGEIYKLYVDGFNDIYIGSTTVGLKNRLYYHKYNSNQCNSKLLRDKGDLKIELLETVYFDDKNELRKRERHFIEINNCINKCKPGRTKKEHYQDNRESILNQGREYYYLKGKERNKDKIMCECGNKYIRRNKKAHLKTKKHMLYINNKECHS